MKTPPRTHLLATLLLLLVWTILAPRPALAFETLVRMQRAGFVLAWQSPAAMEPSRRGIGHHRLFVSGEQVKRVFEVVTADHRLVVTPDQVDRFGFPLGESEAQRQADIEMRVLRSRGIEAEVTTRDIPRVMLYLLSEGSVLQAIDAETGQATWKFPAGNPRYPALEPAVNERFAAVVNGTRLYVIDLDSGKVAWDRSLGGSPVAGPALSDEYVFVPLASGPLEVLPLVVDDGPRLRLELGSIGQGLGPPLVTHTSVAWATNRGFMYVSPANKPQVRFRLETRGSLVSGPAHLAQLGLVYAVSADGHVFAVDENTSAIVWQYSTTESIASAPVAIDNAVYVISVNQVLHCIDAQTGLGNWQANGIEQVASVSDDRIYCVAERQQLAILDAANGRRLDNVQLTPGTRVLTNTVTDRLYLTDGSGLIRCYHEPGAEWPVIHVTPAPPETEAAEDDAAVVPPGDAEGTPPPSSEAAPQPPMDDTPVPEDPFGGEDPFAPAEGAADPFGGAADTSDDPFGGTDTAGEDNPFNL